MTGFIDLHCHVLPGVDDGSADVETSLEFLRAAHAGGTSAIVATPHQHPGRYPNAVATLQRAHEALAEAVAHARAQGEMLPDVHLGAEVHLEPGLDELVAAGERLRLAGGSYLLLELPDTFPSAAVEDLVFRLQVGGITPILAHPERIGQFLHDPAQLRRLVERGALGQATGSSLSGVFGEPCRARTEKWVAEGLLHLVASDAHDLRRRTPSLVAARAAVARTFGEPMAEAMFVERPRAVLQGLALDVPPPAPQEAASGSPSLWKRLLGG